VPDIDLAAVEGRPVHVTLLIGKNQKALDLALVRQIHRMAGQVALVEVGASGRNALDLTLAAYLGRAMGAAQGSGFCIVSKDRDFDAMIAHFAATGVDLTRIEGLESLAFPARSTSTPATKTTGAAATPGEANATLAAKRAKVLANLGAPGTANRPATEKTLRTYLKSALGPEASAEIVEATLAELRRKRIVSIAANGKMAWHVAP
jgi:hypothetical protein